MENAEKGITASRSFVKKLHNAIGTNYSDFVPWVDKIKCEDYDKHRPVN